jgi:SAM-dependent methyltransferase
MNEYKPKSSIWWKFYTNSMREAVREVSEKMGYKQRGPRIRPVSVEWLRSKEYDRIMNMYVPCTGEYGCHEAYTYTRSYINRHDTFLSVLGVFRWRGVQEHLDTILKYCADPKNTVVDFGGAGCPLGFGSVVVDLLKKDAMKRPVKYVSIRDIKKPVDVVFCCHCLEHIQNLEGVLKEIYEALKPGGVIIVYVPSYTNPGWNAKKHHNPRFGDHLWTFGLSATENLPKDLCRYANIDQILSSFFTVEKASYCGDDSIYCFCRKSIFEQSGALLIANGGDIHGKGS